MLKDIKIEPIPNEIITEEMTPVDLNNEKSAWRRQLQKVDRTIKPIEKRLENLKKYRARILSVISSLENASRH